MRTLLLLVLLTLGAASAQPITIDIQSPAHPFPHFWEQMFGSGRAILTLRDSYRYDVKEVKSGFECGIKLSGYDDIKVGDRFEAYIQEKFERTL